MKPTTFGMKYKYLFVVVDDYSHYTITKQLKEKSVALNKLVKIINQLKTVYSPSRLCEIQADSEEDFRNNAFKEN